MLAPAALVLIVFSFLIYTPQQSELQSLQSRYYKLLAAQHETEHGLLDTQTALVKVKKELRDIKPNLDELRIQEGELLASRIHLRRRVVRPSWPAATMQRLNSLMEQHQLDVLESQSEAASPERARKIIQPFLNLLVDSPQEKSNIAKSADMEGREIYRLKVRGRFKDLQSALNSLSVRLEDVLPLSLQMEVLELESEEIRQPKRVWTLTILV